MTHAIKEILGHKECEDAHAWKFRVLWFTGDRAEVSLSYFTDGFQSAIDLLIEYLEKRFKGTKKLLLENRGGHKVYSVMDKKEMRQEVAAGSLKMVRNVFPEQHPVAAPGPIPQPPPAPILAPLAPPMPNPVVNPIPVPLPDVEYVFDYKFVRGRDYFRVQREGTNGDAFWERLDSIGQCIKTRAKLVFFLMVHFPESRLVPRLDEAGIIVEYVVDPKPT